ncbi:MAG: hypothetical protein ABJ370_06985 [Paracoccaceae bacterium]
MSIEIEHTHLHAVPIPSNGGEYLQLTLRFQKLDRTAEFRIEDFSGLSLFDERLLELVERGAVEALKKAGWNGAQITLIDFEYFDVNSPPWLWELVAGVCVELGIAYPELIKSENRSIPGKKRKLRPLKRFS